MKSNTCCSDLVLLFLLCFSLVRSRKREERKQQMQDKVDEIKETMRKQEEEEEDWWGWARPYVPLGIAITLIGVSYILYRVLYV